MQLVQLQVSTQMVEAAEDVRPLEAPFPPAVTRHPLLPHMQHLSDGWYFLRYHLPSRQHLRHGLEEAMSLILWNAGW